MSSLWWVQRTQLDPDQLALVEQLPLAEDFLVLGSAGSGKTNVLLRRAQYVRSQRISNVMVLTFTRPLTEFVKTGCYDEQGREVFPPTLITTVETWLRNLHRRHGKPMPPHDPDLTIWKRKLAASALDFEPGAKQPRYEALFVDEAQDLVDEEVKVIRKWGGVLFCVGDDRQKIHEGEGLAAVRSVIPSSHERILKFHYRVAPEICQVADRILVPENGQSLASTALYNGPTPATVTIEGQLTKPKQLALMLERLGEQVRVYADLIQQGDRLGIIVARKNDRDFVLEALEKDAALRGKAKIIRSRDAGEAYDPSFSPNHPICIITVKGCKGLEFRCVHWPFANELKRFHNAEHYYTVVTRAKTRLDVYATSALPDVLARAHSESGVPKW